MSPGASRVHHDASTGTSASAGSGAGVPEESQTRAAATVCPRPSRAGPQRRTAGPGSTSPVRSLGPARSMSTFTGRPAAVGRPAHRVGHALPARRVVVRAVDARDVHPGPHEVPGDRRVVGGLRWQRDHDADRAALGRRAQEGLGVAREQRGPFAHPDGVLPGRGRPPGQAQQTVQHGAHRVDVREHVRLGAPERREPESREARLEGPDVLPAEREVVREVAGARDVGRLERRMLAQHAPLERRHRVAERVELGEHPGELPGPDRPGSRRVRRGRRRRCRGRRARRMQGRGGHDVEGHGALPEGSLRPVREESARTRGAEWSGFGPGRGPAAEAPRPGRGVERSPTDEPSKSPPAYWRRDHGPPPRPRPAARRRGPPRAAAVRPRGGRREGHARRRVGHAADHARRRDERGPRAAVPARLPVAADVPRRVEGRRRGRRPPARRGALPARREGARRHDPARLPHAHERRFRRGPHRARPPRGHDPHVEGERLEVRLRPAGRRLQGDGGGRDGGGLGDARPHVRLHGLPPARARRPDGPALRLHGRHALHRGHRAPRPRGRRRDARAPRLGRLRLARAPARAARGDAGPARARRGVALRRPPVGRHRLDDRPRADDQPLPRAHEPRGVRLARRVRPPRRSRVLRVQREAEPRRASRPRGRPPEPARARPGRVRRAPPGRRLGDRPALADGVRRGARARLGQRVRARASRHVDRASSCRSRRACCSSAATTR